MESSVIKGLENMSLSPEIAARSDGRSAAEGCPAALAAISEPAQRVKHDMLKVWCMRVERSKGKSKREGAILTTHVASQNFICRFAETDMWVRGTPHVGSRNTICRFAGPDM